MGMFINDGGLLAVKMPGVDVQAGLEMYCGEWDLYVDILRSFAEDTPEVIESLRHVSEESLPQYAIHVHGFKGACANICAETMRQRALALEMKAKTGAFESVEELNPAFLDDAEILVQNIQLGLSQLDAKKYN